MAGLTPVLGTLSTAISGLSAVSSAFGQMQGVTGDPIRQERRDLQAEQNLALAQLQQKQADDEADLSENIRLEREKLETDTLAAEDRRRAALRRAVARQNVQFASQGISSADAGSTQAVLLGLFDESEEDKIERERIDSLRNRALDQDLSSRRRLNILQQSQLKERQRLERALLG